MVPRCTLYKLPKGSLVWCATNSRIMNGRPSGRCCRTRREAWVVGPSTCPQRHLLGPAIGAPWRDLPDCYGPCTTCYNRFVRWRRAGVWGRIMDALAAAHDAAVQMIDTSIVRVHQHAATRYDKLAATYLAFIQLASIGYGCAFMSSRPLVEIGCRASRLASPVALCPARHPLGAGP
jgi:hypothetical protein